MLRFTILAVTLALWMIMSVYSMSYMGWLAWPSFTWQIVIFMLVAHVWLYYFVGKKMGQRPEDFVRIYLGVTVLRILFFGLFILAVIFIDQPGAHGNIVFFLISYFLFTALEVSALFLKISRQNPTNPDRKER